MASSEGLVVKGMAIRLLDLGAAGSAVLLEAWNGTGARGLAVARAGPEAFQRLQAMAGGVLDQPFLAGESRWRRHLGEQPWLDDPGYWRAVGALEAALADLQARASGMPLWRWLGGAARRTVATARADPPAAIVVLEHPRPWTLLADSILAREFQLIAVDPIEWGGPEGVRRLDAIARAFQLELALLEGVPVAPARALAIHLSFTTSMATWPLDASRPLLLEDAFVSADRLVAKDSGLPVPIASGLGVTIAEDRLAPHTGERVVLGREISPA